MQGIQILYITGQDFEFASTCSNEWKNIAVVTMLPKSPNIRQSLFFSKSSEQCGWMRTCFPCCCPQYETWWCSSNHEWSRVLWRHLFGANLGSITNIAKQAGLSKSNLVISFRLVHKNFYVVLTILFCNNLQLYESRGKPIVKIGRYAQITGCSREVPVVPPRSRPFWPKAVVPPVAYRDRRFRRGPTWTN